MTEPLDEEDLAYGPLKALEMDEDEIDAFLREEGVGLLSLASDGEAYGVPVSFGWDGDALYFYLLQFGDRSKKLEFADETETASFAVYRVESKFKWKSVVASGQLDQVPEEQEEATEATMDDNAWFPNLFPLDEPQTDVSRLRLDVTSLTGQKGHGYEHGIR